MKNLLRRVGALAAAVMMCFALTVPALAEESFSGRGYVMFRRATGANLSSWSGGVNYSPLPISSWLVYTLSDSYAATMYGCYAMEAPYTSAADLPSGVVGIYLSFYLYSDDGFVSNHTPSSSDFGLYCLSGSTGDYDRFAVDVSLFEPASDANSVSDGVSLSARVSNTVSTPYTTWRLYNSLTYGGVPSWYLTSADGGTFTSKIYVTSYRIVTTESDDVLDGIEGIVDAIVAQTSILSAYYGDIVAICNQIYQRLGDMQQTQIEANELLSSLVSLLNSTNGKISALNQAMSTYFELVLKSLENESLSIQDCINDAELRLETYLKPIVDYFTELEETTGESASSLPGHKTDLDKWSSDSTGIDDDAQSGLAAVLPFLSAFSFVFQILGIVIGLGIFRVIIKKGAS